MENINYIPTKLAIEIHDNQVIKISGGLNGIKDFGQLDSTLEHLQNDSYYPTFEKKLARLLFAISKFHTFHDGNKRTSIALGTYFLKINDYDYCTDTFIEEMENVILDVVQNYINQELLIEIVKSIIDYNYITDEVKIKIINSKTKLL